MKSQRALRDTPELSWRVLGLLNVFRLLAPVVFGLVFLAGGQPRLVGESHPDLFRGACLGYFVAALALIAVLKRRQRTTVWHAYIPGIIDIGVLSLIVYASGGAESGLAIALLVPVGAVSVLVDTRGALVLAAGAALTLLGLQLLSWVQGTAGPVGFAQAGYYGAMLFLAAGGGTSMARRLRETEEVVRQRDIDVANLAELSEYIVQHLRESIVVVDAADRVRLINESARLLLGPDARPGALLGEISPRLLYHVESWRRSGGAAVTDATLLAADGGREFEAHFAALGSDRPGPVIAFLDDTSELAERVQQTKLAALGRLSASIAHEIRNPVGAMSHAAQLLAETAELGPQERRLTEIITQNGERVSTIIANVMQLSRRESTRPERVAIGEWLRQFHAEFCETLQLPATQLRARLPEPDFEVRIDPTHLRQVVWNLCENATRHSADVPGNPPVDLMVARLQASGRPFLEVADRGPGIPEAATERIFEPFFTGRRGGTGLGLFIARELAQCNGALLLYEPRAGGGSIFRVVFADPHRWEGRTDA
ncbi:MAG TPA: HAMP domain-containing sensor histidine kinase [Steroidobacteraceae bacterium]|nr:HAMP domain-containing sensor histidine kinase [Steroidobacteraceae bacterium]